MSVAYIGRIIGLTDVENSDFLQQAEVVCGRGGKWLAVVRRGDFDTDDLCEVYLQDAELPEIDRFSFMKKHGYRVRMARLRGAPSECLVMPLTIDGNVGDDIMDVIGVTKYEKPLPPNIGGEIIDHFPSFIPKTDEPNYQTVPHLVEALIGRPYYITEKCDGSSGTVYYNDGHFGCCSRNYELAESSSNAIWAIANKYDLKGILEDTGLNVALQFEVVGPGIQSNPMGLNDIDARLFSVYDIDAQEYLGLNDLCEMEFVTEIPLVRILEDGTSFDDNDLQGLASGAYPNGEPREGIVVRPWTPIRVQGDFLSFKVINLEYRD